jgi:hypothetical protein
MKEQKLGEAIAQGTTLSSRSNAYLKNAMYNVKSTELIKTVEMEKNKLLDILPQREKSELRKLEDFLVLYAVFFLLQKDTFINGNVLNNLRTFLIGKNVNPTQLKDQDLHRIIVCIALRVFAEQGSEKAKRLEHLIKRMPLIG